jgi:hypothetical protein
MLELLWVRTLQDFNMTVPIFASANVPILLQGNLQGDPVSYKDNVGLSGNNGTITPAVKLSDGRAFVLYTMPDDSVRGVVISNITGASTDASVVDFDFEILSDIVSSSNVTFDIARLDDNSVVVVSRGTTNEGQVFRISGLDTSPIVGNSSIIQASPVNFDGFPNVVEIDSTTCAVVYRDGSGPAFVVKVTDLDSTPSVSTRSQIGVNSSAVVCDKLDSNSIIAVNRASSGNHEQTGYVIDVSGATPSVGAGFTISTESIAATTRGLSVKSITPSSAVVMYSKDVSNSFVTVTGIGTTPVVSAETSVFSDSPTTASGPDINLEVNQLGNNSAFICAIGASYAKGAVVKDIFTSTVIVEEFDLAQSGEGNGTSSSTTKTGLAVLRQNLVSYFYIKRISTPKQARFQRIT